MDRKVKWGIAGLGKIANKFAEDLIKNSESDLVGYKLYYGNPTGYSFDNSIGIHFLNLELYLHLITYFLLKLTYLL